MSLYISVDPGIKKCGLLLADIKSRIVIEAGMISINTVSEMIFLWNKKYIIDKIIIGNGTNFAYIETELKTKHINNLKFVNEQGSTLRARFRYWQIWPPNYLVRWIPRELLFPPENLDAIAALILLEDHLNFQLKWPRNLNLKTWP